MAVNEPAGDGACKDPVRKRSQLPTKMAGETRWTKHSRASGRIMNVKRDERQSKGVRREQPAACRRGMTVSFGSAFHAGVDFQQTLSSTVVELWVEFPESIEEKLFGHPVVAGQHSEPDQSLRQDSACNLHEHDARTSPSSNP